MLSGLHKPSESSRILPFKNKSSTVDLNTRGDSSGRRFNTLERSLISHNFNGKLREDFKNRASGVLKTIMSWKEIPPRDEVNEILKGESAGLVDGVARMRLPKTEIKQGPLENEDEKRPVILEDPLCLDSRREISRVWVDSPLFLIRMGVPDRYRQIEERVKEAIQRFDSDRFQRFGMLGIGSWSKVYNGIDKVTQREVAIKVSSIGKSFFKGLQKEHKIYEKLNTPGLQQARVPGVLNALGGFVSQEPLPESGEAYEAYNLVLDKCECNLHQARMQRASRALGIQKIRVVLKEVLETLQYLSLREPRLLHGDLKPENIFMDKNGKVFVADFGLSIWVHSKEKAPYELIQSSWYRAPEVVFKKSIGVEVDMWSLGCIIYEMYIGEPLFPVRNENERSSLSIAIEMTRLYATQLGELPDLLFPDQIRSMMKHEQQKALEASPKPFEPLRRINVFSLPEGMGTIEEASQLKDLILSMLRYDSESRVTPSEALAHPFMTFE